MTKEDGPWPDPQDLIPPELQATWIAVPRAAGKWIFVQSFLLGAGGALALGSLFASDRAGWWPALPIALAVMTVNALVMKRREREWMSSLPKIECPEQEQAFEV